MGIVYGLTVWLLGDARWLVLLVAFCYLLAYVGLEVYLLVRRDGQTLGKGLMGLRVVPVDAESELRAPLVLGQAAVRMLMIFLPFALASAAGSNPGNGPLNALALLGVLTLLTSGKVDMTKRL